MKNQLTITAILTASLAAAALASEQPSRLVASTSATDETATTPDFIDRLPAPIDPHSLRQESDVNDDGIVDVDDLLTVISHWGQCPAWSELSCVGDIDSNFVVDTNDLTAVIANWGAEVPVE